MLSLPTKILSDPRAKMIRQHIKAHAASEEVSEAWRKAENEPHIRDFRAKLLKTKKELEQAEAELESAERAVEDAEDWIRECGEAQERITDKLYSLLFREGVDERLIQKMLSGEDA